MINAYEISRQLQTAGKTSKELADAIVEAQVKLFEDGAASRTDLAELRSDFAGLRSDLKTEMAQMRADFSTLRAEVKDSSADLKAEVKVVRAYFVTVVGIFVVNMGAFISIVVMLSKVGR